MDIRTDIPLSGTLAAARPVVAAFAGMGLLWGAFAALLPDLKTMLGVDEAGLGFMLFLTPLAAVAAMLLAPGIGDRLGRGALPVSGVLMALAFTLPGQASAPWLFPLAMMACGMATGLTDVLMNARAVQIETERGLHLMNLVHAAYPFGYAVGALGAGLLRGWGWEPARILGTMAAAGVVLALAACERDGTIRGLRRPKGAPRGGGLGPVPLIGGGMVLIAFLAENAAETWSALHIEKTLGGSPGEGAMGPAAMALTMGFARLAGQGLAGRIGPLRLLMGGTVIAGCGTLVASQAASPAMALAGFMVMGTGASVIVPTAFSLVGRLVPEEARARAVARVTLLGYFGYFFGPPGFGFVAGAFGLRAAFVLAAALVLAIVPLALVMLRAAGRARAVAQRA